MATNTFFPITTIAALLVGIAFFPLAERKVLATKPTPIKAWAASSLLMALPILIGSSTNPFDPALQFFESIVWSDGIGAKQLITLFKLFLDAVNRANRCSNDQQLELVCTHLQTLLTAMNQKFIRSPIPERWITGITADSIRSWAADVLNYPNLVETQPGLCLISHFLRWCMKNEDALRNLVASQISK